MFIENQFLRLDIRAARLDVLPRGGAATEANIEKMVTRLKWVCGSMKPGNIVRPSKSISLVLAWHLLKTLLLFPVEMIWLLCTATAYMY
jgi:hypothetical protein